MTKNIILISAIAIVLLTMNSCQQPGGNSPGSEYMPDMTHSVAYEANVYNYYYNNTWGTEADYHRYAQPRVPVNGTIPRSIGNDASNTKVPYYYENTEEERTRAMAEIVNNPFPITDAGLKDAKELYNINCGICHGAKGDGNGWLVDEANPNAKYLAQPANFLLDEFVNATNGRYYHAVMYGKNVMGGYADKLSYEERWNVIHYIRSLQAKDKKLTYNQLENTLNSVDKPAGVIAAVVEEVHEIEMEHHDNHDHEHGGEEGHHHGDDHDHGNHGH